MVAVTYVNEPKYCSVCGKCFLSSIDSTESKCLDCKLFEISLERIRKEDK